MSLSLSDEEWIDIAGRWGAVKISLPTIFIDPQNYGEPFYTIGQIVFYGHKNKWNIEDFIKPIAEDDQGWADSEYWGINHPSEQIEDYFYDGSVYFYHGDDTYPVRLDVYCFAAKLAALFYAEHIDKSFDPWPYFPGIDRFFLKYSDPATFNKIPDDERADHG